jgi:hypothetical protein
MNDDAGNVAICGLVLNGDTVITATAQGLEAPTDAAATRAGVFLPG